MDITVFSSGPTCMKCKLTERKLEELGLPYHEVRVDQNEAVAEILRRSALDSMVMPVVYAVAGDEEDFFNDFRPDRIHALLALSASESEFPVAGGVTAAAA